MGNGGLRRLAKLPWTPRSRSCRASGYPGCRCRTGPSPPSPAAAVGSTSSPRRTAFCPHAHQLHDVIKDVDIVLVVVDQQRLFPGQLVHGRLFGKHLLRLVHPGGEMKGTALVQLALHPDLAVHQPRNLLADGQSQSRAPVLACGRTVHLLEQLEHRLPACPPGCRSPCRAP